MEEANLEIVNPQIGDIRREWDWVKPGIEEVIHLDPHAPYRPEDIYASCISGESHLWVHPEGFVITTTQWCKFTGEKTLLLWVAWAHERGNSVAAKCQDFFERVAVEQNFSHMETITSHMPIAEYLSESSIGWEIKYITLGKDLRG